MQILQIINSANTIKVHQNHDSHVGVIMEVRIHYQRRVLANLLFSSGSTADHAKNMQKK